MAVFIVIKEHVTQCNVVFLVVFFFAINSLLVLVFSWNLMKIRN